MTIGTLIHHFDSAGRPDQSQPSGRARVRRFVARHRLTDEERRNLRDYYRSAPAQAPSIMTAALGGHPQSERGTRR